MIVIQGGRIRHEELDQTRPQVAVAVPERRAPVAHRHALEQRGENGLDEVVLACEVLEEQGLCYSYPLREHARGGAEPLLREYLNSLLDDDAAAVFLG